MWPFRKKIVITRRVKRAPDAPITSFFVRFDFLDYDLEFPYFDGTSEKYIMGELRRIYRQIKP